jgi:selenocysteine lyase/cysteine desulfurase
VSIISPQSPLAKLPSLGHYFHPTLPISYKLAPGGAPYELQVGCAPVLPYLLSLGSGEDKLGNAFERIQAHENTLSKRLLEYLTGQEARDKGVRVVGPETADHRAPTISFVVVQKEGDKWRKRIQSKDIVAVFDKTTNVSWY